MATVEQNGQTVEASRVPWVPRLWEYICANKRMMYIATGVLLLAACQNQVVAPRQPGLVDCGMVGNSAYINGHQETFKGWACTVEIGQHPYGVIVGYTQRDDKTFLGFDIEFIR